MPQTRTPLPLFRTIVFAADFSDSSREAFKVACSLAREEATRLFVVHVIETASFNESMVVLGEMGVPLSLPEERPVDPESLMGKLREIYTPGHPIPVEYRIAKGDAATEILRLAAENRCDLIALGTHGRTGLERLLVGSVAETVMRKAHRPVLTVHAPSCMQIPELDVEPPETVTARSHRARVSPRPCGPDH